MPIDAFHGWSAAYETSAPSELASRSSSSQRSAVTLSLTADRWDDDQRDTSSLGADLAYASEEHWKAAVGTYYSLYKYDFLEFDERDDVRTYYVRASRELSARLALDVQYELEDDDLDTFQTLRLGVLWRF